MLNNKNGILNKFFKLILVFIIIIGLLPTNLIKSASPSNMQLLVISTTQIRLNWIDYLANEQNFKIEKKTDSGNFLEIATLPANYITYYDSGVVSGHTYTYRIYYLDNYGNKILYSDEVSATTTDVATPTSLAVTPVSSTQLELSWTYPNSKSYDTVIERMVSGSSWTILTSVKSGTTTYKDTGLEKDKFYYYRIKAVAGPNVSSMPYQSTGAYTLVDSPSNLYAFAASSSMIYLMWTDNSSSESGFVIERKTGSATDFSYLTTVYANTTYYLDSGLTANTRYVYRVKSISPTNSSAFSSEIVINTVRLAQPSNISSVSTSDSEIDISWIDNSDEESGFEIWRKSNTSEDWGKYATVGRNVTTFTDGYLSPDTIYYYKVRGFVSHSDVYSSFSNVTSSWTIVLRSPIDLQFSVRSNKEIELTWDDNSSSENGFKIERKTGMDGDWEEIASLPANSISYINTGLTAYTQYFYRIKVFDNTFYNTYSYSDELEVNIGEPVQPSDLTVEAISLSQIKLTWSDKSNNEQGFKIERKRAYNRQFEEIGQVNANVTSYMDKNLSEDSKYYYRIRAFNKTSNYTYSNEVATTTKRPKYIEDVTIKNSAYEEITNLASRDVLKIKQGFLFGPNDKVTRGEFIYSLVKALKFNKVAVGSFADVSSGHEFYKEIMIATKMGIISRNADNRFNPDQPIKREEMAAFIARALKAAEKILPSYDVSILNEFSDKNSISPYAVYNIASIFGEGIIDAKSIDGKSYIDPKGTVTKAEMAMALYRVIDK